MKGLITVFGIVTSALLLTSCVVQQHPVRRGMPPGHAKRIHVYEKRGHGHHKHKGHHGRGRGHGHHR